MATKHEIKLQSEIIKAFSDKYYPEKRGRLYHIPNERITEYQLKTAKAIGVFSGVADLRFDDKICVAMEVKVPGSDHKLYHVEQQVEWGRVFESTGHVWRLVRTVDEAINCTEGNYQGMTLDEVQELIDSAKKRKVKTIIF